MITNLIDQTNDILGCEISHVVDKGLPLRNFLGIVEAPLISLLTDQILDGITINIPYRQIEQLGFVHGREDLLTGFEFRTVLVQPVRGLDRWIADRRVQRLTESFDSV